MVVSSLDLNVTCTCVGLSLGINVPLLGVTVKRSAAFGQVSVDSNTKLYPISYLPLFLTDKDCFASSNTRNVEKSSPPSAPVVNK